MAALAQSQTARLDSLFTMYRAQQLELDDRNRAYADIRGKLQNSMQAHGFKADEVETMFEAYERMWTPIFGASGSRLPGNDAARRLHDAAMRAGVRPEDWQGFVAAVTDYRVAENRSNEISAQLYMDGGSEKFGMARGEVDALLGMKSEIIRAARRMNPGLDIRTANRLVEAEGQSGAARFDPLRRTISFALDPTSTRVDREAYSSLWQSVSGLLNEKERELLASKYAPNAATVTGGWAVASEKAAEAFAKYMAPGRNKKNRTAAFARMERFFGRVANAARGYGFQVAEDVWKRAADGQIAARHADRAVRMPSRSTDAEGYEAAKSSLKNLSVFELHLLKRDQSMALDSHRRMITTASRRWISHNPAVRGFKGIVTYFNPNAEDTLRADRREMAALSRGLGAIEAELKSRQRSMGFGEALGNTPPAPQMPGPATPGPGAPGPGSQGPGTSRGDSNVVQWPQVGRHGQYVARESFGTGPKGFDKEVSYVAPDGFEQKLAYARDDAAAQSCVDAFERVAGQGRAGAQARALAEQANQAGSSGNLDIHVLRSSKLIDAEVDRRINEADVHALVYPLKTGDLVFCGKDGRWRAATVDEFRAFAAVTNDEQVKAAEKVVSLDAHRAAIQGAAVQGTMLQNDEPRLRSGEVQPVPQPAGDTTSDTQRQVAGLTAAAGGAEKVPSSDLASSAMTGPSAIAARIDPAARRPELEGYAVDPTRAVRIDPSLSSGEARALVNTLSNVDLLKRHADTMAGLATTNSNRLRMEIDTGKTALEVEMKSRGLWQAPLEAAPRGTRKPTDRGQDRD